MLEMAILWEWLGFAARWLHVITAMAWIGSSFYFIALDLGLRKRKGLPEGVHGEEWQVHGGGFYHIQKYLVAPKEMPEHLIWFKWESYATWLSGFVLLAILYYVGADLYLIDRGVLDVEPLVAIGLSVASIVLGWLVYNLLCKSPLGRDNNRLMLLLFVILVAMAWGYTQLFSARAAFLHLGAFTATIMSANVFFIIIPNQKKVVAKLKAGETPNPALGMEAKQRSTHNNYLTLPVVFLMLSNHYPLAYASEYSWIIAALVFLEGVVIRHYFNSKHAGKGHLLWCWFVAAGIFIAIIALSILPVSSHDARKQAVSDAVRYEGLLALNPHYEGVKSLIEANCSMCHAREPLWEGIVGPPKNVVLEQDHDIARLARDIYIQAGVTHAMPPGNITFMEPEDRVLIMAWYESAKR